MDITDSSNKLDVSVLREDLKYMHASNVNVSCFVSMKLSSRMNYIIWKAQMICLMESHMLLHIVDAKFPSPGYEDVNMNWQYDRLVKGWIFGTMSDHVLIDFVDFYSAQEVWMELESRFGLPINTLEDVSSNTLDVFGRTQDMKYMLASTVNVSNFVTMELSGYSNYYVWKTQMLCLIESHNLLFVLHSRVDYWSNFRMIDKFYDLINSWIFGTMKEELLKDFRRPCTSKFLWKRLESTFDTPDISDKEDKEDEGVTESLRVPEIEDMDNNKLEKELYEAAVEGCWWKIKSLLKVHENAATKAITENGNTILHLEVEMGHNYFLEKILEFLKDGKVIEIQNSRGHTALHVAAIVGNTQAAQLLLQKREDLLTIQDHNNCSPLDCAIGNMKINTYVYMSKTALQNPSLNYDHYEAMGVAIVSKEYDLAATLLKKYPPPDWNTITSLLMSITITFPSNLGFTEAFIYPSFNDVRQKTVVRGSLLFHSSLFDKCVDDTLQAMKIFNNTCFSWLWKSSMILLVPIATLYQLSCLIILMLRLPFSMSYFLLWKVLAVTVLPIKNIEKKKKDYQQAKEILSLVCDLIGTRHHGYRPPMFEAVRQGTYEVVDEILFRSPTTIYSENEEKHNVIQLAIINRSEKVYNLIYHIIEYTKSSRIMTDSNGNNLVHLAGRLAPSFVLDRTTGAALRLQLELLWFQEVEKLFFPLELIQVNNDQETPSMVFTREHQDLMKQGESWMKTTAESCSITAALIVTVVFAAAITVPGGSNQESGIPLFKKEMAFTVFAVSNAFSLFTAATSLLLFLSILTARFSEKDFLLSLPRRLIFGFLALFLSTTSMIVAFGAILFLVFCDQRPWILAPICGFACLPISVIVAIKLPLLVDLIQSTYFPIFGKQTYLDSCKINRKNLIFRK